MTTDYLKGIIKQFKYYRMLGEKTIARVGDERLFWQCNPESNSIATIVKHLSGNMISRWTDLMTTDGEKESRNRDAEFENVITSRKELVNQWNAGWNCLFDALNALTADDLEKVIYVRNQGHTVIEAINRQLAHYPYHVGQIVFIGKMVCEDSWQSLSIPRGSSQTFNADKFSQPKHSEHFTDEIIDRKDEKK